MTVHRRPRPLNQPTPCRTRNRRRTSERRVTAAGRFPTICPGRTSPMMSLQKRGSATAAARRSRIGEDVTEQLEYEPGKLFVFRHIYPKYACSCCKDGVTSAPPRGQSDRGRAGWAWTAGVRHCQQVLRSPAAVSPAGRAVPPWHLPGEEHALRLVGPVCTGITALGRVDAKAIAVSRLRSTPTRPL